MSITPINVGNAANDGTGDPLRVAYQKINLNTTELVEQIATKADDEATTTALAGKANLEEMTEALAGKADAQTTEQALAQKANAAEVQEALDLKANTADVDTALALKADTLDVQNALAQMPGEAPDDGKQYARQNKAWTEVQSGGGTGTTNLGVANRTASTLDVTSSTGAAATLPSADEAQAGLMSAAQVQRLGGVGLQTVSVFDTDPQNVTPVVQLRGGDMGGVRWPHATYNVDLIAPHDPAVQADVQVSMPDATGKIATQEWVAANVPTAATIVQKTSATGVALLPEGTDAQRPGTGDIPAGAALVRGNTQSGTDYFLEFRNRVSNAWEGLASRPWVSAAITTLQTLIDGWLGFAIVYPNGGSEASPANVSINSRYEVANPFPGYHVMCTAQIRVSGKWGIAGWLYIASGGQGVIASEFDDKIIVQTGTTGLSHTGPIIGQPNPAITAGITTPTPCRVLVWKVKGATA